MDWVKVTLVSDISYLFSAGTYMLYPFLSIGHASSWTFKRLLGMTVLNSCVLILTICFARS